MSSQDATTPIVATAAARLDNALLAAGNPLTRTTMFCRVCARRTVLLAAWRQRAADGAIMPTGGRGVRGDP